MILIKKYFRMHQDFNISSYTSSMTDVTINQSSIDLFYADLVMK